MYLVAGLNQQARRAAGTSARRRKASESDAAEIPAPADTTDEQAKARRRRRAKTDMLGRGYEYMDLEEPVMPSGLTALAGDAFGGGAIAPMTPGTWMPERRRQTM
ncbi:hypothetical protein BST28_19155 [Mycolicibacter kumamotonensis]|uniref:PPE-PPW subfamily C-terminal domain-containing protein n=1 Tax=Mycolicibacter kumamotonensis TaxID=354243 RepID=A0A1X0DXQ0_9MYCO|nr:hypothetical protein BST28_19155 [Mycolicibacter kumamotonensis]